MMIAATKYRMDREHLNLVSAELVETGMTKVSELSGNSNCG